VIGPGRELEDLFGDWAALREIEDTGCLLVRPDQYVGFRAMHLAEDAAASLTGALRQILGRG
jgi:2,4-dichlorophenol 6-monooxygenase